MAGKLSGRTHCINANRYAYLKPVAALEDMVSRIVFAGGQVFDGTGTGSGTADVVIERGRIVEIGTGLDGDQVVDCTGQSVLPGMFDCHVHLTISTLNALEWESAPFSLQFYQAARNMELTLAAGITTVRDASGADLGVQTAQQLRLVCGPRMQISISALDKLLYVPLRPPSKNPRPRRAAAGVEVHDADPVDDRSFYTIGFANDLASPLAIEYESTSTTISLEDMPPLLQTTQVGSYYQTNLTAAQITAVSSTTVSIDAGLSPPEGFGIEVRANDYGWGEANGRNLLGRFNTQTFDLARLARTQTYFLRLYDGSSPPKYSRYAAALHVDYAL